MRKIFKSLFIIAIPLVCLCSSCAIPFLFTTENFKITTTGVKGSKQNPIVCSSWTELTFEVSKSIAEEKSAIYISPNFVDTKVPFGRLNATFELDAYLNTSVDQTAYDESGVGHLVFFNEYLKKGWTYKINFTYCYPKAASTFSPRSGYYDLNKLPSANDGIIRAQHQKRAADFNDFPILSDNVGVFTVHNSEELWWAISNKYKPSFAKKSEKVQSLWNKALNICRKIISDDMTDLEKITCIYSYLTGECLYDYDCIPSEEDFDDVWQENTAYFLEGALDHNTAVCDSLSKTFALLAGIEGLDVKRGFGYVYGDNPTGHAWNYASIDGGNTYYLICPTWGRFEGAWEIAGQNIPFNFSSYDSFMVKNTYFQEAGGMHFDESIWKDLNKATSNYNAFDNLSYTYNDKEYDFVIDSDEELEAMLASAIQAMGDIDSFALQFALGSGYDWSDVEAFRDRIKAYLISHGNNNYFYSWGQTDSFFPLNPNYFEVFVTNEPRPS